MQPLHQQPSRWLKPAIAGLMAAIVLLLALFVSNERLHLTLHQDSATPHHLPCAVCSFAQGQLQMPAADLSEVIAALSVSWTLPSFQTAWAPEIDLSVASSRGPPVSVSSL